MRYRHWSAIAAEWLVLVAVAYGPAFGGPVQGDVELLKTVALQHKANLEALLTWKGEAVEEITATQGDKYNYRVRNNVAFAYDQVRYAVRWNKDPQEQHLMFDGSVREAPETGSFNSNMVVEDKTYSYASRVRTPDGKWVPDLIIGSPQHAASWDSFHFDPRRFLADPIGGAALHEDLLFMYDNARMPESEEGKASKIERKVTRAGDRVTVEVQQNLDDGSPATSRKVFDLLRGGNLVECYNKYRDAENVHTYEYEEKNGAWVPKSYKWVNLAFRAEGNLQTTRTVKWGKSVVNVSFQEDEFTLAKLGVKPGDEIIDHRIGLVYRYAGGLGDSELLSPALLAAGDINAPGAKGKGPLRRIQKRARAGADTNLVTPEGADAGLPTGEQVGIGAGSPKVLAESRGTHRYFFLVVVAMVVGCAGIAYGLTRKFRKE